jgi:hypothetical protein
MTLNRTVSSLTLVLTLGIAAALFGGAPAALADPPTNPFAGSWSGTFEDNFGSVGTIDWTITDAGQLTGTGLNTVYNLGFSFVGHITSDGKVNLIGSTMGGGSESGNPFLGTAVINDDGQMVATTTSTWNQDWVVVGTLDPVP